MTSQIQNPLRRRWLGALGAMGFAAAFGASGALSTMSANRAFAAGTDAAKPRILILYFSWSGSSEAVAREAARLTGGKLARVETAKPYPAEYQALTEAAKAEREADARPALKPGLPHPQDYDVIVIGHPIWSGRMPNALRGYIETHDFSGKTIAHFATHGGSGLGESDEELRSLLPKSQFTEGLAVYGWSGVRDLAPVGEWLKKIGLVK